jgi:ribosomal protein S18 acetylase RimI-like enzyme
MTGFPLLAFARTDPSHQRRGIGQRLIEDAVARLDSARAPSRARPEAASIESHPLVRG